MPPRPQYVVRGGIASAQSFRNKPQELDERGCLVEASVQTFPGVSPEELGSFLGNGQIGVSTLLNVLAIPGAAIVPDPILNPETGEVINPYHALLSGVTPEQAESLFLPDTRPNVQRVR